MPAGERPRLVERAGPDCLTARTVVLCCGGEASGGDEQLGQLEAIGLGTDLLLALLLHAPLAVTLFDPKGRCVLASETVREVYGAVPPPDYNIFEDEIAKAEGLDGLFRRAFAGEVVPLPRTTYDPRKLRHVSVSEAREVVLQGSLVPVRDARGEVTHVAVAVKDVSAEVRLEAKLTEQRRLEESGILGIATWSLGGEVLEVNDRLLEMIGYTREEVERRELRWDRATPPEHRELDARAAAELRETGRCVPFEKEIVRKDGSRIPVLVAAALFEGDPSRGISFTLDLSERKRAEQQARETEERFRALIENSYEAIELLAPDGGVLYASPSVTRILGWKQEEYVGSSVFDFVHPEDHLALISATEQCVARPGEPVASTVRRRHADGSWRVLESVRVSRLEDPALGAIVVNYRDVTEQRSLEQQFLQAQKMEAIGRLAGGVAHDFNNMLSAILGFAGIVARELREDDPLQGDVREITSAAERASTLTRQLLAFSRKQILEPKVLELNRHVASLENMLRRLIGENIELELRFAPNLARVRADPAQIEQVVLNLVLNARDALPNGGHITIETANAVLDGEYGRKHLDVTPGRYVMLAVTDDGEGMEESVRQRIFEPFFTTKGVGKGTGLGLATVFGIVKQSGGHIFLYSEPGQGTTFKVYFPETTEAATVSEARGGAYSDARGTETVLLVEDEAGVRAFVKRALQREGYVVLDASNGGEALLIAEQHDGSIDLLLTDIVMPRMSGRALAERLAQVRPTMRVIYMSGYTENTSVHPGVLDEGTVFLSKPLSVDVLVRKVREVLDAPPQGGQQ